MDEQDPVRPVLHRYKKIHYDQSARLTVLNRKTPAALASPAEFQRGS